MTEKERIPADLRIYRAGAKKNPVRPSPGKTRRTLAVCGICTALLCAANLPETSLQGMRAAAGGIARASARLELADLPAAAADFINENIKDTPTEKITQSVNVAAPAVNNTYEYPDGSLMLSFGSRNMPSSVNEERLVEDFLPPPEILDARGLPYPESFSGSGKVTSLYYGYGSGESYIDLDGGGQIRNVTKLSRETVIKNAAAGLSFDIKLFAPEDEPQILIMHTHTTESYQPDESGYYDPDYICRTTDSDKNMTAVGNAMAEVFESKGIRTLHDVTVHDYPSYNGSYDRSRETVKAVLSKYPSIKIVLDVHRDAIEREDGQIIAPTAVIDGKSCAQVMIICGCDDGTMGMPDCMKNLGTAAFFEQAMESRCPGLTRPVLYDYRKYNQDLTAGSLLLEVGGHANSLDQAVYAGKLAARAIGEALTERYELKKD